MDRMTYRDEKNKAFYHMCKNCDLPEKAYKAGVVGGPCNGCYQEVASCAKLADYEDAEEQGRLFEFPIAIGDEFYTIDGESITKAVITGYGIHGSEMILKVKCEEEYWTAEIPVAYLEKTWFRTLEDAKQAQKEGLHESDRTVD